MDNPLIEARVFNDGMLLAITDTFIVMLFLTAIISMLIISTIMYYGLFRKVGIDTGYAFIPIVDIWFAFGVNNRIGKLFGKSLTWRIVFMHIFGPIGYYIVGYGKGEEPIQQEQ